jgi:hypothetical protein
MEWKEIKDKLIKLTDISILMRNATGNDKVVFDIIDRLPADAKKYLHEKYKDSSGPVLSLRSDLAKQFMTGPVNRPSITKKFEAGKLSNPRQFVQYKSLFSIFYPFLARPTEDLLYSTFEALAAKLRSDLALNEVADIKCVGFDGGRNIGTDHIWFAIYNNTYPNQQTAKQLYFAMDNGEITYGVFDRAENKLFDEKKTSVEKLNYNDLLDFYKRYKEIIVSDNFRAHALAKHPKNELINKLNLGYISGWLIKPGEKGSMWKRALKEASIRIGWGDVIDDIIESDNYQDDFILEKLHENYPKDGVRQTNNCKSIKTFMQEVKANDVIFAVSGVSNIIGVGVITSDCLIDNEDEEYKALHEVDWLIDLNRKPFNPNYVLPIKTVTQLPGPDSAKLITEIFRGPGMKYNQSNMTLPYINTIYYGPPGTGKTHFINTLQKELFTDSEVTKSPEELLKERVSKYPFWKLLGAILGVSKEPLSVAQIVEHPIIKARVNPANKTKPNNLAWGDLQAYADNDSTQLEGKYRRSIQLFHKNTDSKWWISDDKKPDLSNIVEQELLDIAAAPHGITTQNKNEIIERNSFITFHQKYSYEDFIEGIKPTLKTEIDNVGSELQFELKKGIFYNCCVEALKLAGYSSFEECHEDSIENRKAKFAIAKSDVKKNFALFIDEINRANISAVLGELITLLELDKRTGEKNEMWLELPYSNEKFSVPANLFVVGTMNTADRSIALLDIALRRRFEFVAIYPEYKENEWYVPILQSLNQAIFKWKKNPDFFIGHTFFMNRTAEQQTDILNKSIIPLLYEYCQNNTTTIKTILSEAGVRIKPEVIQDNFRIIAE